MQKKLIVDWQEGPRGDKWTQGLAFWLVINHRRPSSGRRSLQSDQIRLIASSTASCPSIETHHKHKIPQLKYIRQAIKCWNVHVLQQIVIMLSARDCCQYEWSHSSPILGRGSKRLKLRCNDCKQGHLTAIISPIIMKFIDDNLTNICSVNNMNHFLLPCNLFKFLPHALIMVKKIEVSVAQSTKFMHVSVSRWQLPRIWNDTKHGITMVW